MIYPARVYRSIFNIVTGVCNHHHGQLINSNLPLPKKPISFSSHSSSTHLRQQLLCTYLCKFVYSGHLMFLDILYNKG